MQPERTPQMTWKVQLPGGQARLREMVLFVARECAEAEYFGLIKLNKILWRADFEAFAERGVPVTGRQYQRLPLGPAPVEMVPILNELQASNAIRLEERRIVDFAEKRPVALAAPNLRFFSEDDLDYIRASIHHYWRMTGTETSDDSHGVAWSTRDDGVAMPYESAYLSNEPLDTMQKARLLELAAKNGWRSR